MWIRDETTVFSHVPRRPTRTTEPSSKQNHCWYTVSWASILSGEGGGGVAEDEAITAHAQLDSSTVKYTDNGALKGQFHGMLLSLFSCII
jgi:hypothetical protein